jgi:hypothetical protein
MEEPLELCARANTHCTRGEPLPGCAKPNICRDYPLAVYAIKNLEHLGVNVANANAGL